MGYKFIMIYSDGPMGSTSLGSLIEKYGFINLPFRKFLLSEYVMGLRDITDKSMQYRFIETINILSKKNTIGGTSVKDRNSREGKVRTFKPSKKEIDSFLSYEPENLHSLLSHCFIFAARYTIYKEFNIPLRGFIIYELPQFRIKYNFTQSEYIKKLLSLKGFTCFLMNRGFKEWSASLISQQDCRIKNSFKDAKVSLEKLLKRWTEIQSYSDLDDLYTINLESILLPNVEKANQLLSSILNLPLINYKYLIKQNYDLYGSILSFEKAFNPSDKSFQDSDFLNKIILEKYIRYPRLIRFIINIIFNILRSLGLLKIS